MTRSTGRYGPRMFGRNGFAAQSWARSYCRYYEIHTDTLEATYHRRSRTKPRRLNPASCPTGSGMTDTIRKKTCRGSLVACTWPEWRGMLRWPRPSLQLGTSTRRQSRSFDTVRTHHRCAAIYGEKRGKRKRRVKVVLAPVLLSVLAIAKRRGDKGVSPGSAVGPFHDP
jgi:hypothetical protein